jgi:phage shock protein PspC (stress-responsive transcriptional regulator)
MNKRLYKSSSDKALLGVCGGIAEYFDVDSVVIRLLVVIFALSGAGVLFYIFAAIIMREPDERLKPGAAYGGRPAAGASYGPGDAETYSSEFYDETARETENFDHSGPERPERPRAGGRGSGVMIFGLLLIIIGLFYLINRFVPIFHWIDMRVLLAVLLVLAGIYFVARR